MLLLEKLCQLTQTAAVVSLKSISKQSEVGSKRSLIRLGCDGVPYSIASKILQSVFKCEVCNQEVDTHQVSLEEHSKTVHPAKQDVNYVLYFDHILLVPEAGHM